MKRVLVALALMASACAAQAADMKVPAIPGYPYNNSGIYFGIGTEGAVAGANTAAPGLGTNLYTAGAALTLNLGWQGIIGAGPHGTYQNWWAIDNKVSWQNLGGTTVCGGVTGVTCSVSSQWDVEQRFLVGFPVTQILAVLPNLNTLFPGLPALPPGVVTTTAHPYVGVGLHESPVCGNVGMLSGCQTQVQVAAIVGTKNQWTAGLVANTWAEFAPAATSFTIGPAGAGKASQGSVARVGLSFEY